MVHAVSNTRYRPWRQARQKWRDRFAIWNKTATFASYIHDVMAKHNHLGLWGEQVAARYLAERGYAIMERDWRFGRGKPDIDLICKTPDGRAVVFVEVKTRESDVSRAPEDAVDARKMRRIGRAADEYVKTLDIVDDLRFDIVAIVGSEGDANPQINHIKDAFNPLLV